MNLLSDILTYIRRIIKASTSEEISDNLLIDYVNRFFIMEVNERIQPFDFRKKYEFQTKPGISKYNMPLYDAQVQPGSQTIEPFPVYQGFMGPAYVNGYEVPFFTEKTNFYKFFPKIPTYMEAVAIGNGTTGPYTLNLPISISNSTPVNPPIQSLIRGHVDIGGIIATGSNIDPPLGTTIDTNIPTTSIDSAVYITTQDANGASVVIADSGQMYDPNENYGLLMEVGRPPYGNAALPGGYSTSLNTINYLTGAVTLNFPVAIPSGVNINAKVEFYQSGLPRGILFNNNTLTIRMPPDKQYTIELEGFLAPAAFLSTSQSFAYGYMAEYIARGAARKILSDTGDVEQFNFYEPFFKEQEALVLARSTRQKTATRTQTIYSMGHSVGSGGFYNYGQGGGL